MTTIIKKTNTYTRKLNPSLFFSWLLLSIRSRAGFKAFLSWFRLTAILSTWVRYFIIEEHPYKNAEIVLMAIGLIYALGILYFSKQIISKYDTPKYHIALIIIDTLLIGLYIFFTTNTLTELYLFLFLPMLTASHFLSRKNFFWYGSGIALFYLFILIAIVVRGSDISKSMFTSLLIFFESIWLGKITISDLLKEVFTPWIGKAFFLVFGAIALRAQRNLPKSEDRKWVSSPADARKKLESMLDEIKLTIPYDTASIQLKYRERLMIVACRGFPNYRDIYQIEFPVNDARFPNHLILETKEVQIVSAHDYRSFADKNFYAENIKTWMGIPLISPENDECFGIISLDSYSENGFKKRDYTHAKWFAKKMSSFLVESALGPAALTQATNRSNLFRLLKDWANILPHKTAFWDDDTYASHELAKMGQKIFRVEDCSIFFQRHKHGKYIRRDRNLVEPVLHMIASTSVPSEYFKNHDEKVTGLPGDGLAGFVVHRNKLLNYDSKRLRSTPYKSKYTGRFKFLFSRKSRQLMIAPLRDSQGNAIGAIKIENRVGTSSESEFFTVEKDLFELYSEMVSMLLETIRQRNYIKRIEEDIHGMRGIIHHGAIQPLQNLQRKIQDDLKSSSLDEDINEIIHVLEYVKMVVHRVLSESGEILHLEKEGLIHAIHHDLKSLQAVHDFSEATKRIEIEADPEIEHQIPYDIQEVFLNVAREGLLNIARHSRIEAKEDGYGKVSLHRNEDTFSISVEDNGIGFDVEHVTANQRQSYGLTHLREIMKYKKINNNKAEVIINSQKGSGTVIQAIWSIVKDSTRNGENR